MNELHQRVTRNKGGGNIKIRRANGPWAHGRVRSGQQAGGTESAFFSQADCYVVASGMCVFASLSCSCPQLVVFSRMLKHFHLNWIATSCQQPSGQPASLSQRGPANNQEPGTNNHEQPATRKQASSRQQPTSDPQLSCDSLRHFG